jgi:hypothetical protein
MGLAVDRRPVKARLRPILARLEQNLPVGREQMSQGYKALQNVVHGDDFVPLTISEEDLGFLKALVRESEGRNQALAQQAVRELQGANDTVASSAGPHVVRALAEARDAARMGFETEELLQQAFGKAGSFKERGALTKRLTAADDDNIDMLRRVKAEVPLAVPGLARALVDRLAKLKGERMWAEWKKVGDETKGILFTKEQAKALDNYTELAARIASNPNPSKTALVQSAGRGVLGLMVDPMATLGGTLGMGSLSAFLQSPAAVRLFTRATTIALKPAATAAAASAQAAQVATLLRAAQRAASVPALAGTPAPTTPEGSVPTGSAQGSAGRTPNSSR